MARKPGGNRQTHLAQVVAGLMAMQSGAAKTKTEAAAQSGTSTQSLKPCRLGPLAANSPHLHVLTRTNALEITAEISGEGGSKRRVSMREALSTGAEKCVAILAELSPKVGSLTKDEERRYGQAQRWLLMCRQMGLFGDNEGATLPGELRGQEPEATGGVDWWREGKRMSGMRSRMLTVTPAKDEIPIEDKGLTTTRNVGQ